MIIENARGIKRSSSLKPEIRGYMNTGHKTKAMRFKERQQHYRDQAKFIIELEPQRYYFIVIGQLMAALKEQCSLNKRLLRKVDQTIFEGEIIYQR